MSINYKEIKQLPELTSLRSTDKIMMSRENGDIGTSYTAYNTLYGTLSAALSNELTSMRFDETTVTELDSCAASDTRITTGRVASQLNSKCTSITNSVTTNSSRITSLSTTVDSKMDALKTEILASSLSRIQFTPSSYVVKTIAYEVTSNSKADDVTAYYEQNASTITISANVVKDSPIVHIVENDCNVLVQVDASYKPSLFINPKLSSYTTKQTVLNNCNNASLSADYIYLGMLDDKTDIVSIPCKKGTTLCVYKNQSIDNHLKVLPVLTSDFSSGDIVLIKEIITKA